MPHNNAKGKLLIHIIRFGLTVLTVLSFLKGILISLDIDESYATAIGYRLAMGDRLLRDLWEPHQLSGIPAAFFTSLFLTVFGSADYLLIYLRIIGAMIHTGLGLALYRQLKKALNPFSAFCMVILHLNFLPKWIMMPEFELMHYWCLLSIFILSSAYFTGPQRRMIYPFLSGILLTCSMLCYPTMVLLYPFYILAFFMLEKHHGSDGKQDPLWKSSVFFTLGALLSGVGLLLYLFSYLSPDDMKRYISCIFLDTSHGIYTMGEKWASYLEQILSQTVSYGWHLLASAAVILIVCITVRLFRQKNGIHADVSPENGFLSVTVAILLLAGALMQVTAIYGFLFEDKNQFYLQVRYLAILLPGILLALYQYKKMALWLYLCILPALLSVPAVLLVTNMDTNVAYSKLFTGVLGSFLILEQYHTQLGDKCLWKKTFPILRYAAGGMLLAGLLVCRLILIRVSGCLPVTVMAPLEKMETGPEKGILILADTAAIWNENYQELETYVNPGEKVLYIGAENLVYVKLEAIPATPSTQGTTVYSEMFLRYYEEHPDRTPDVIVYDKTFGENPAYALSFAFSLQNPVLFQWIEENYGSAQKVETDHMIILRKQPE